MVCQSLPRRARLRCGRSRPPRKESCDDAVPDFVPERRGTITAGTYPQTKEFNGGFTVIDVTSRERAVEWAAKIAVACRCAQEIREFMPDPAVGN